MNQKRRKTINIGANGKRVNAKSESESKVLEEAPIEAEAGCMSLIVIIAIVATGIARLILEVFE